MGVTNKSKIIIGIDKFCSLALRISGIENIKPPSPTNTVTGI
jgi:hypothetical protein